MAAAISLNTLVTHINTQNSTQSFTDHYSFNLANISTVLFGYTSNNLLASSKLYLQNDVSPTGPSLGDTAAADVTSPIQSSFVAISNNNPSSWSFSSLAAGSYYLLVDSRIQGKNETGTFTLTEATITPVPEPETYAMLLAGFGLVGFMSYRRQRNFS